MTSDLLMNSPWAGPSGPGSASGNTSGNTSASTSAGRAEADRIQHDRERLRAARVIAARADDVPQARDLLAMLGLTRDDIQAALGQRTVAA